MVEDLSELAMTKVSYNVDALVSEYLHPVNSCAISNLGEMGVIHPSVAKNLDNRFNIVGLELDLEELLNAEKTVATRNKISKYQASDLDFNFVMGKDKVYGYLENALSQFRSSYLLEIRLKDVYINQDVLPDKISYTISIKVTPKDRTLEASDIEKFSKRLIDHMAQFDIVLR